MKLTKQGLNNFQLKYIAMFLMVLDHIHYFFGFTGKIPVIFTWLGRLAAPIFLFCLIEGFTHTHNKKAYFLKIYAISIGMGLIQFSFYNIGYRLVRADGFFPENQMLASFALLLVVLQGFEWCSQKKWGRGLLAIVLILGFPYLMVYLFQRFPSAGFLLNVMIFTVTPLHTAIKDGGTLTIIMGVVLYLTRKNRKKQAIAFAITVLLLDIVYPMAVIPGAKLSMLWNSMYQWMEIFAVIFFLLYNKQRGNGPKYLFYWFYPAHIYVLYAISFVCYGFLK